MAERALDLQDLHEIVELMKGSTRFSELALRTGEVELVLRRGLAEVTDPHTSAPPSKTVDRRPSGTARRGGAPRATPAPAITEVPHLVVTAPSVGTVRLAPAEGTDQFVQAGQAVQPGTPLCEVEVMGQAKQVVAVRGAVVREVLVCHADVVQFGQALFVLQPA